MKLNLGIKNVKYSTNIFILNLIQYIYSQVDVCTIDYLVRGQLWVAARRLLTYIKKRINYGT